MGPVQAIAICLRKSFQFSGKASRPEYWWFLPVGTLLPVMAVTSIHWLYPPGSTFLSGAVFVLALLPLMAVTKRRLNDGGGDAVWFETPTISLLYFLAAAWAITGLNNYAFAALDAGADGPSGFGVAAVRWLGLAILVPIALHQFLIGFIYGIALFLKMAVPSKSAIPSSNRNEVSP
jgi:uncharacterized membrane protein YhaH (DUF805 family)